MKPRPEPGKRRGTVGKRRLRPTGLAGPIEVYRPRKGGVRCSGPYGGGGEGTFHRIPGPSIGSRTL